MSQPKPFWSTCSDWMDGIDKPDIPSNPEYPWILVYAALDGHRLCFAEKTYEEAKAKYDDFLENNKHNINCLGALMAHRSMFKNNGTTLHNRY